MEHAEVIRIKEKLEEFGLAGWQISGTEELDRDGAEHLKVKFQSKRGYYEMVSPLDPTKLVRDMSLFGQIFYVKVWSHYTAEHKDPLALFVHVEIRLPSVEERLQERVESLERRVERLES